jgi:hypothetical protein
MDANDAKYVLKPGSLGPDVTVYATTYAVAHAIAHVANAVPYATTYATADPSSDDSEKGQEITKAKESFIQKLIS